jgi:hypothetical protein
MRRRQIIEHGPRRPWWAPWRLVCRCGLEAYPCPAERMLERQRQMRPPPRPIWDRPTSMTPNIGPLLTPGQLWRTRNSGRP